MRTYNNRRKEQVFRFIGWLVLLTTPLAVVGCSSVNNEGKAYVANDEMLEGPGLFTGKEGAFNVVGGSEKPSPSKPISAMSAAETTQAINEKIRQLDQDKLELEKLKRQLNKKSK